MSRVDAIKKEMFVLTDKLITGEITANELNERNAELSLELEQLQKQVKKHEKTATNKNKFKFTKRKLESLKPSDKTITYHDTETTGLKVSLSKTGLYTFFIYRKVKGRPERIKLGNFPSMSVEQARISGRAVNTKIDAKNNPNDARREELTEITLKQLFDEYLELHAKPNKKSWRTDVMNYKNHLSHWDNRRLSTITKTDITRLHNKIGSQSGSFQANRVHSLIRTMFYYAMKAEPKLYKESTNPAKGIKRFKEESRERKLESDELQAFFRSVSEEQNETMRDYVLISLLTGARRSNVLSMEWKELHLERAEWLIPANKTKNGKAHTLPLISEALQILEQRKVSKSSKFVFPGHGCQHQLKTEPHHQLKSEPLFAGLC